MMIGIVSLFSDSSKTYARQRLVAKQVARKERYLYFIDLRSKISLVFNRDFLSRKLANTQCKVRTSSDCKGICALFNNISLFHQTKVEVSAI